MGWGVTSNPNLHDHHLQPQLLVKEPDIKDCWSPTEIIQSSSCSRKRKTQSTCYFYPLWKTPAMTVAACLCAMCACATFPVGASHQQGPSLTIVYCPLPEPCFLTGQNSRKWECSPNTFLELHPHSPSPCTPPSKKHGAQRGSTPNRMLISDTLFRKSGREQVEIETDRLRIHFSSTQTLPESTNHKTVARKYVCSLFWIKLGHFSAKKS